MICLYFYLNRCVEIDNLKCEIVKFGDIPIQVQSVFLNRYSSNYETLSTPIENSNTKDWFVNLDSNVYLVNYKCTTVPGLFRGRIKLRSKDNVYCMANYGVYGGVPFIVCYQKNLYIVLFDNKLEKINQSESNVKIFFGLEF